MRKLRGGTGFAWQVWAANANLNSALGRRDAAALWHCVTKVLKHSEFGVFALGFHHFSLLGESWGAKFNFLPYCRGYKNPIGEIRRRSLDIAKFWNTLNVIVSSDGETAHPFMEIITNHLPKRDPHHTIREAGQRVWVRTSIMHCLGRLQNFE